MIGPREQSIELEIDCFSKSGSLTAHCPFFPRIFTAKLNKKHGLALAHAWLGRGHSQARCRGKNDKTSVRKGRRQHHGEDAG